MPVREFEVPPLVSHWVTLASSLEEFVETLNL
jgi:hypothetical protein